MFKGINWSLPGDIHNQRIGQETAILQVIGQGTELVTRNYERYHQELLSLDHFLHPKKLRYHLILSRVIDDQPVKESDWTKGTTGHIQPKLVAQILPFLDHYLHAKNQSYRSIPSRGMDNQRILQSDYLKAF